MLRVWQSQCIQLRGSLRDCALISCRSCHWVAKAPRHCSGCPAVAGDSGWDYCTVTTQSGCSCLATWTYGGVNYGPGECRHAGLAAGTTHPLITSNTFWCAVDTDSCTPPTLLDGMAIDLCTPEGGRTTVSGAACEAFPQTHGGVSQYDCWTYNVTSPGPAVDAWCLTDMTTGLYAAGCAVWQACLCPPDDDVSPFQEAWAGNQWQTAGLELGQTPFGGTQASGARAPPGRAPRRPRWRALCRVLLRWPQPPRTPWWVAEPVYPARPAHASPTPAACRSGWQPWCCPQQPGWAWACATHV